MADLVLRIWVIPLASIVLSFAAVILYRLYFHPLSQIPGPPLWAIARLPYVKSLCSGNLVKDVCAIHRQYGDIVRIAPDEVSCATGNAWQIVHGHTPGKQDFPLDPRWFSKPPSEAISIRTASDPKDHGRIRGALQGSFNERSLALNEPIVQQYVDELIAVLKRICIEKVHQELAEVNMVDYFNFTVFDIIGDLCFAEPFHCLSTTTYHPWVSNIYKHLQASAYLGAVRFYPSLSRLMMKFIPASVLEGQKMHRQESVEKVRRRMNLEQERPDFMSQVLSKQDKKSGMSNAEIESTFHVLLTAGSETTSLVLSGIMNYLLRYPDELARLTTEVRNKFSNDAEISFASVEELEYLKGVVQEGLRLCPPHPQGNPRVVPNGGATLGDYWLPGGTHIAMHQWTLFRKPQSFHAADMFKPERWLPSAQDPASPYYNDRRSDVMVFGTGSHRCIGQHLAWSEIMLIFAKLVWNFDIRSVPGDNMKWENQKTLFMVEREPVRVMLKPVQRS